MVILKIIKNILRKQLKNRDIDSDDSTDSGNKKISITSHFKKLSPFILQHWQKALGASILLILSALFSLPQPLFTKYIIDDVIVQGNIVILALVVGVLIAILLSESFLSFLKQFYFFRFEQEVIFEIQKALFEKVLRFPKSFFDSKQTGYLMSRLSGDVVSMRLLFSSTMVGMLTNNLKFVGGVAILFYLHWKLALLSLTILPFFFAAVRYLGIKTRLISHETMEKTAHVSRNLQESIAGVSVVKSFAAERREIYKMTDLLRDSMQANIEHNTVYSFSNLLIGVTASIGTVLVLWYGAREIIFGRLTIGGFFAFNSYLAYLYGPSRFLAAMTVHLQSSFAALERVFALFNLIPEDEHDNNKISLDRLKGQIHFNNVSFSYDHQKPALRNINFSVRPGEKIALVGPTGAGKSTLVNIIIQLYRANKGNILFDGINVNNLKLHSLRERIGIVSQEIFLFDDSILNNIRYGRPDASDEDVIRIAKRAKAHEFIMQLPEGYETKVGERAVKLSAGQKQRISIARALLKDPDILIFDEATSALDSLTEKDVKEAIFDITNGKTTFIIAHRLSTLRTANRILVMDKGEIVEEGTHDELICTKGLYGRMWEQQNAVS